MEEQGVGCASTVPLQAIWIGHKASNRVCDPECKHSQTGREIKKYAVVLNSVSLYRVMRVGGKDL